MTILENINLINYERDCVKIYNKLLYIKIKYFLINQDYLEKSLKINYPDIIWNLKEDLKNWDGKFKKF